MPPFSQNDISKLWKGHYLQSWDAWSAHYPSVPSLLQRAALSNSPPSPSGDKGVECPNCGRHYKLKSSLRNHQKWECGKEPQFQCPYCNYRAKQKMHVARHIERMHREKLGILDASNLASAASPIASILPGANPQQQQTILQ
ncbi:hypothetical protein M8J77_023010 [Diaphorina citri]|nr:hypothetical protein M8J77_023010 [Diaphorina citri]